MKLYRSKQDLFVETDQGGYRLDSVHWDELFSKDDLLAFLKEKVTEGVPARLPTGEELLAPVGSQEVWASGVTYTRSRSARMEESKATGGEDFYDRVYTADRPELFFKSAGNRVIGHGQDVRIRRDSTWSVPEPELALAVNAEGQIIGYAVGNDMSARDIEGANPLYLPQAKVYDGACALGPGLLVQSEPLPETTEIVLTIARKGDVVFSDRVALSTMKRTLEELVRYLFLETSFPNGCYLLTGTGIVPPDAFALQSGDRVRITIDPIGTLENRVI